MGRRQKSIAKSRKSHLTKENFREDKIIKNLEKKLNLNKKKRKTIPKSFVSDGLDYLLDLCDDENRKLAAESEKRLTLKLDDESNNSDNDDELYSKEHSSDQKHASKKRERKLSHFSSESLDSEFENDSDHSDVHRNTNTKNTKVKQNKSADKKAAKFNLSSDSTSNYNKDGKKNKSAIKRKNNTANSNSNISKIKKSNSVKKAKKVVESSEDEDEHEDEYKDEDEEVSGSEEETNIDSLNSDKSDHSETDEGLWEDIYGRKRNKAGEVIVENKQKYITPALRSKEFANSPEKSERLLQLKRQMKGLLNRLAESNMHNIVSQLDELYMSNSQNDMNEMLSNLMLESIVAPVLTGERLVTEHMMCVAILHANIGTQVGAHFIMVLIKKLNEMLKQSQDVENKELDNLVLMIAHLYNFKLFGSQLLYDILKILAEKFTEKEIELILLILKTAGFWLRKDDPLALKELILNLQQKAAAVKSSNTRIQFMLEVLLAIKNNNMNKIPQYDHSHVEHLKKVLKTIIRKGNSISQLNLSLDDLLNADERGKWWVVGSAWSGKSLTDNKSKDSVNKPVYSQKILDLARAQRMNTDVRKNIFCILMSAEDYLDAFEKLHHLGLKDRQEKEIIYVILNCCLQERTFNPYYAVLLQKFCEYDRKYQMTIQYTLWDKLKMLNNYNGKQVINMAKIMSYLFIQKALPLSILKVIQLGELDSVTMKLFRKIMLDILLHENTETCLQIFEKVALPANLHQFRDGLRLFLSYFLLKNFKKESISEKQMKLLEGRIALVDKILTSSTSKVTF